MTAVDSEVWRAFDVVTRPGRDGGSDGGRHEDPTVLILTPVKQATGFLAKYFALLAELDYPAQQLSLGFLEGDSVDETYERLGERLASLRARYRRVTLVKWDARF